MGRRGLAAALVFVSASLGLGSPRLARAGEPGAAALAYDRGAAAYDRGDYPTAATELARADELSPNDVALTLAIGAALRTGDAVLTMTLVDRAESRRPRAKDLDAMTDAARRKVAGSVGKLRILCPKAPCEATLDGAAFEAGKNRGRFVRVGPHHVAVTPLSPDGSAGATEPETFDVSIEGGKTVELIATARFDKTPAPAAAPADRRLSPTWFWLGAGATAVLGAASVVSGVDTASKHDAFARDRSNADAADAGRSADHRTTGLVIGTAALAVITGAVGLWLVDWKQGQGPNRARIGLAGASF
jgi:hypothetical protein